MRKQLQPSKKDARIPLKFLIALFLLGGITGQIWLVVIPLLPIISCLGILNDPEAPEE